jgi:ATP-dependent DNA helicase RecG
MDTQKLRTLINRDENSKLDFKLKLSIDTESSKKELAKDISAIANSRGGRGHIIFGVEDKTKEIVGIKRQDFHEETIQQIIASRIDPPVPVSVDTLDIENVTLGIITIYTTEQKPHQIRETGAFYIRRGSTTDIMRKDELASMLEETGIVQHELLPVLKASYDALDLSLISDYFDKSNMKVEITQGLLLELGILIHEHDINVYHPTFGGLLLFGKQPELDRKSVV